MHNLLKSYETRTWLFIPIASALFIALGAVFAMMTSTHPFGIATVGIMIFWIFIVGFGAVHSARWASLSSANNALLFGVILFIAYVAGEIIVATQIEQAGLRSWFSSRWNEGITLFGKDSFALKGWLWATAYAFRLLLILATIGAVMIAEGDRQFCHNCKRSTTFTRWKTPIKSFDQSVFLQLQRLNDIFRIEPTPSTDHGLWIRVRTCKCTRFGEITVDKYKIKEDTTGSRIFDSIPLTQRMFTMLIEWVKVVDPHAKLPIPEMMLDESSGKGELFTLPVEPLADEWESYFRYSSADTACDWIWDNHYTKSLRERLSLGHYETVDQAIGNARNINDIACIYEAASDWRTRQDWIDIWCDEQPNSTSAHTVAGISLIKLAWVQRGSSQIPKNVPQFINLLNDAMTELDIATELDPENVIAWSWKIYAAKGLQLENEQVRGYFDNATKSNPDLHAAHYMYNDYLTPKWGGSQEACIGFAQEILKSRSEGSPSFAAVAYAHFEFASEHHQEDKKSGFNRYINQPDVRSDIIRANQLAFTNHQESMVTPRIRAFFAYLLWELGEREEAKKHMQIIGKKTPWGPFAPSALIFAKDTYSKARKACGL